MESGLCGLSAQATQYSAESGVGRQYLQHISCILTWNTHLKIGLTAILFCICMDELLYRLKQSHAGCLIVNMYLGGLGYADDLGLLAPSSLQ